MRYEATSNTELVCQVIHLLLTDSSDGESKQWQALQHYNDEVRRYNGLSWRVGARLGRRLRGRDELSTRAIGTAANAVVYDTVPAQEFVDIAMANPDLPFRTVHKQTQQAKGASKYLQVPSVTVAVEPAEREAIKAYCAEQRQPLSALVEEKIHALAAEVTEE